MRADIRPPTAQDEPAPPQADTAAPSAGRIMGEIKWMGVGHLGVQVGWYATILVLGALLPPNAFGTVAIGMTVVGMGVLLAQSGTGGSLIAATRVTSQDLRSALRLNLAVGVLLTAGIALAAGPIVTTFAEGGNVLAVRVLGLTVLLAALTAVPMAVVRKTLKFRRFAVVTAAAAILTAAAAITAAVLGAGVWALVVRQVAYQGFVAIFGWFAVRDLIGAITHRDITPGAQTANQDRLAFLTGSASFILGFSLDNAVVGAVTDATELGYYALAFTLAFAPFMQLGTQLGQVLFPAAAATPDLETVGRRTLKAARLVALILLPVLPPVIVLAPMVLPALFGDEWRPIVAPFQIMIVVGVGHSIINTIGEALSGTGNMRRRAPVDLLWALGTLVAIFLLVQSDGIRGAAIARLIVFAAIAWWYATRGAAMIGTDGRRLWLALRGVVLPVAAQSLVTALLWLALSGAGVAEWIAATVAAAAGIASVACLLIAVPSKPLRDGRSALVLLHAGR